MCYGILDIFIIVSSFTETLTFLLVINMMLPLTKIQQNRKRELHQFFLNGFVDFKNLEQAVMERNPDIDELERQSLF